MRLLPTSGRVVGTALRGVRLLGRGVARGGRWSVRRVGRLRERGAGGEVGMLRLFDLHAASCAGDTLIAIGLAGTIFFDVPLGEARSRVALYLLVTMVPFALLAPVVGPLLDHFRHGRRYALATTMLGRAFLAWLLSDYIHGLGLYPAAFGVLALSRAYGVGRSAAVPRLLPEGLGLSQAGARASVYGSIAGALVAPIGLAAFLIGPQWPLRIASLIFIVGMIIALRLPPRADSDPPETVPRALRLFGLRRRNRARTLSGPLVTAALLGSAGFRALYGFLLLFLAFAIKAGDLTTDLLGRDVGDERALALIGVAFAAGTFLATAVGTRVRIHHPVALQATGLVVVATAATLTTVEFSLLTVTLLCLGTAILSGMAKLAVDAVLQERIRERLRASAFAHSETLLMLAFVGGGALGLIPLDGRVGIAVAAAVAVLAAGWAVVSAVRLRGERLNGRAAVDHDPDVPGGDDAAGDPRPGRTPAGASAGAPPPAASPGPAERDPSVAPVAAGAAGSPGATATAAQRAATPTGSAPSTVTAASVGNVTAASSRADHPADLAPPGYHIYRPSSAVPGGDGAAEPDGGEDRHDPPGSPR